MSLSRDGKLPPLDSSRKRGGHNKLTDEQKQQRAASKQKNLKMREDAKVKFKAQVVEAAKKARQHKRARAQPGPSGAAAPPAASTDSATLVLKLEAAQANVRALEAELKLVKRERDDALEQARA